MAALGVLQNLCHLTGDLFYALIIYTGTFVICTDNRQIINTIISWIEENFCRHRCSEWALQWWECLKSYQIADWWQPEPGMIPSQQLAQAKKNNEEQHSTLEVQVCPKSEVKDGYFYTMRAPSRPIKMDQSTGKEQAIWNSFCDLGNDEILAVSQFNNRIYTVRGKIVMK